MYYQQTLEKQLISKWQGPPTTKKPAPAVFNITNGEKEMQNNHIMALALALCNAGTNSRVTIPRLTGKEFRELLDFINVLRG
ncbi:TPA: hypothetical protein MIG33_20435 [Klebsiella pneumoniae]|nr:hypothetical protein [Klebsiella pneumoniae]